MAPVKEGIGLTRLAYTGALAARSPIYFKSGARRDVAGFLVLLDLLHPNVTAASFSQS